MSPFLPHSYSESSFPVGCFHVDIEKVDKRYQTLEIDVSLMFTFENGYSTGLTARKITPQKEEDELHHAPFSVQVSEEESADSRIVTGICMSNIRHTYVPAEKTGGLCGKTEEDSADVHFMDQGSFAIAVAESERSTITFAKMMSGNPVIFKTVYFSAG